MKMLKAIFDLFTRRLRLSNPWNYKVPVLIAVTYLVMLQAGFGWVEGWVGFAFSVCTILGIAGFGYLSNDLGDRDADRKAGKANLLLEISMGQTLGILGLFVGLSILPWVLYFPLSALSISCLGAEFLLFILYVLPPFRLKERGWMGLVTDALYAHAIPTFLAAITFYALASKPWLQAWPLLSGLVAWQFCLGLRNILLHQLKDADNDRRSGLRTCVTQAGEERALRLLAQVLVPMELLTWLALLGILTSVTWLPLVAWPVYLAWKFPQQHGALDLRGWLYRYLDDFYIGWLPLMVLLAACLQDWRMLGLATLHVLLFKSALSPWRNRLWALIFKPS
jgi:4-hydroxybenzoate polyprenyltransferase